MLLDKNIKIIYYIYATQIKYFIIGNTIVKNVFLFFTNDKICVATNKNLKGNTF